MPFRRTAAVVLSVAELVLLQLRGEEKVLRELHLDRLNSLTKYPSIPTYHALGDRGALLEQNIDFSGEPLLFTEKVDGTNSRVIVLPGGEYVIGSREQLLHAGGDVIFNPAQGIVEVLRETSRLIADGIAVPEGTAIVYYFETFGGKITAASKQYTGTREVSYRLFDIATVPLSRLADDIDRIAAWRDEDGQQFFSEGELLIAAADHGLSVTPRIMPAGPLPEGIDETREWLEVTVPKTLVPLDVQAGGKAEGLVVRTEDRSRIAKIRFEDYRRHFKRNKR